MKPCLREGTLQSYLDGELAEGEMRPAAAHLEVCAGCRDRLAALEAANRRVSDLLGLLAEGGQVPVPALTAPATAWPRMRWAAAILLPVAAAALLWLTRSYQPVPPPPAPTAKVVPETPRQAVVSTPATAALRPRTHRVRKTERVSTDAGLDGFVQLDTAPFQTGMVVRVMLPPPDAVLMPPSSDAELVAADLLIGEDGRARAIRFVE
jgi:anti-sigma factor RsiW